jgi:type I restriction enzyme S subunit
MKNNKKLIPELRFPDFKNEGEWNYDKIDNLFHLQDGYAFSSNAFTDSKLNTKQVIRITDINNQNKNGDKVFVLEETTKALGVEKYKVKKGDLLLSLTGAAGFNFFIWESDDAYINQRTMKLNPKKKENDSLKVILEPLVHSKINEIGTGQNNNLSKDALKEIEFPYPNPKEQQKIASCLSSLDDLIESHNQKLDLLKDHKKGLMQNLFPQQGEKEPKYRFPEFTKDGNWGVKSFEQLFTIGNGRDYKHLDSGDIPVYGSGGYMLSVNDYLYDGESVCIGRKGTIDKPMFLSGKFWTVDTLFYTHSFKKCLPMYIFYVFENIDWRNHNEAGGVPSLSKTNIYKIEILVPPTIQEQKKIASCLTALDKLINAQTEKIEQLKLHKKGLMQGLFPKMID